MSRLADKYSRHAHTFRAICGRMANGKLPAMPIDINILMEVLKRRGLPVNSDDVWTDLSIDVAAVQEALDRGWDFQVVDQNGNPVEVELDEGTAEEITQKYGGGYGKNRNRLRVYPPEGQAIAIGPNNDVLVFQDGKNVQTRFVEGDYIADKRPIVEAFEEAKERAQAESSLKNAAEDVLERAAEVPGSTVEGSYEEGKFRITIPDGRNGPETIVIEITEDGSVNFDVTNPHDWGGGDDEGHDDPGDPDAAKRKAAKNKMTDALRRKGLKLPDKESGIDLLRPSGLRRPPSDSPLGTGGGHTHSHGGPGGHTHDAPAQSNPQQQQTPPVLPPRDSPLQRFSQLEKQIPDWMKKGL